MKACLLIKFSKDKNMKRSLLKMFKYRYVTAIHLFTLFG